MPATCHIALLHMFSDDVVDMTAFTRQRHQTGVMCHILACLRQVKVLAADFHLADTDCNMYS